MRQYLFLNYEQFLQNLKKCFIRTNKYAQVSSVGAFDFNQFKFFCLQIGTRFKRIFGESYYRIVVTDFYPSPKSMIVRCSILLEPNVENYYHATNIWFSPLGYVKLGPFPLLPDNVFLIGEQSKEMRQFNIYKIHFNFNLDVQ